MLNLAQVQKNSTSNDLELQILAYQIDDGVWKFDNSTVLHPADTASLAEGTLVLLERSSDNRINNIQPAKDWILSLLQKHFKQGQIDHQLVAAEQSKIEQWRQEITVQNLELNRRFLEIETRREQLQELEQSLKKDRQQLQELANSLKKEDFENN